MSQAFASRFECLKPHGLLSSLAALNGLDALARLVLLISMGACLDNGVAREARPYLGLQVDTGTRDDFADAALDQRISVARDGIHHPAALAACAEALRSTIRL